MKAVVLLILAAGVLTRVFLVQHSHMDYGWLKTINGYFNERVEKIYSSVMKALEKKSDTKDLNWRRFMFHDLAFLKMWINEFPEEKNERKERIRALIESGALEIISTGMVMPDTACPHFDDLIENHFAGIFYTERNFGTRSQAVWQIDSFGQSLGFYWIAKQFGIHDAFAMRFHEEIKQKLTDHKIRHFVWKMPNDTSINFHIVHRYQWPEGYNCENYCMYWVPSVNRFESYLHENGLNEDEDYLVPFGDDFTYQDAASQIDGFEQHLYKKYENLTISTVGEYLDSFYKNKKARLQFSGDFIPYYENQGARVPWAGFFTSKPFLKYKITRMQRMYRAMKNWLSTIFHLYVSMEWRVPELAKKMRNISEDISGFVHHDTITGTSMMAVDLDYIVRLQKIEKKFSEMATEILGREVYTCDFLSFFTTKASCSLLSDSAPVPGILSMFIVNPTFQKMNRLVKIAIPKQVVDRGISFSRRSSDPPHASIICIEQMPNCLVYIDILFTMTPDVAFLDLITNNENALFDAIRRDQIDPSMEAEKLEEMKPFVFYNGQQVDLVNTPSISIPDVKSVSIYFDRVTIEISSTYVSVCHKVHPINVTFTLEKWQGTGDEYTTQLYKNMRRPVGKNFRFRQYQNSVHKWGLVVENTKGLMIIYQYNNEKTIHADVMINYDLETNFYNDVALVAKNHRFSELDNQLWLESNGLFEMKIRETDKMENSIGALVTRATLRNQNSQECLSVWTDRPRGVTLLNNELIVFLQRSGVGGRGNNEHFSPQERNFHQLIFSHSLETDSETEQLNLRRQMETDFPVFLAKEKEDYSYGVGMEEFSVNFFAYDVLRDCLRVSTHFVTNSRFILRVHNSCRKTPASFVPLEFFAKYYSNWYRHEVDFAMVSDLSVTDLRDVKEDYQIQPLGFVTFLLSVGDV